MNRSVHRARFEVPADPAPGFDVIHTVTPQEEQDWNRECLARPIDQVTYRVWLYRESALVGGRSLLQETPSLAHGVAPGSLSRTLRIVMRESGGGAAPVGPWMVGVSVVLPARHPLVSPGLTASYQWLGELHAQVLKRLGIRASVVAPSDRLRASPQPAPWSAFAELCPWDVVASSRRKIVGLAQVRRQTGVLLVAGTLVNKPDWHLFAKWMGRDAAAARLLVSRATDCESELGVGLPSVVAADLADALGGRLLWRG